jgi:GGDEF domain-containing protein
MKKFEILRYLKRFSFLIFLLSLAGSLLIYLYADNKQAYTASVVIKYTNSGVADGYAPDGSKLDVNEIYSSAVISQAMDALGASGKLSNIRSNVTVTPIIPDDQQKINDALIEKGEEITYFPNTYRVSLVVSGKQGANYARNMLDAILQSYCTYYTEKYVEQKLSLNPSSHLLENGYDYYECIRILENDTNDMQNFLLAKREHYPDFRSSKTGYTYADLCAIYSSFKKYTIPELYAQVLSGPQIRDGTVLQEFLANSIADSNQTEQVDTGRRTSIEQLIDEYVQKNAGILESYFTEGGDNVSSNYILGNIEQAGAGDKAQTTYDGLILELVDIDKKIAANQIDREFLSEILTNFQNVDFGGTSEEHTRMEQMINDYEAQLQKYYEIVNVSSKELNLYISADYLKMMSSVRVAPSINVKLYLVIALVLFFVIGCCGAIVLGRLSDVVDYLLYTDKKSGLPNREKLDVYINGLSGKILPEDYTCFALQLDNLSELSKRFGYTVGDGVLKDFSGLVQLMGDTDGMIGYNGIGKFNAFFDECSDKKASVMVRILESQVEEYNKLNPEYPIKFTAAWATTSSTGLYEIRDLLRLAQSDMIISFKQKKSSDRPAGQSRFCP